MRGTFASIAALTVTAGLLSQEPPSFADQILPILRGHCFDCHRAAYQDDKGKLRKPKGGLRLDGRAWIERGGDGGPVLSPGHPDDSELYLLVSLDPDDPDIMPSKGQPLDAAQVALIARWILAGAPFGDWEGAAMEERGSPTTTPAVEPSRVRLWRELSAGLSNLPASTIAKATADRAQAAALIPGGPLLRVSFAAHEAEIDDDAVAELSALREHLCELVLRRTKISGRAVRDCARMPRLTRLDLSLTRVGSADLKPLTRSARLRSLNLFGTAVDDRAIDILASMTALERVYLGNTGVTAESLDQLRQQRPDLQVYGDLQLPRSERGTDAQPARGRRR